MRRRWILGHGHRRLQTAKEAAVVKMATGVKDGIVGQASWTIKQLSAADAAQAQTHAAKVRDLVDVLCCPKNVVRGCVIRVFLSRNLEQVFWPAEWM